LPDSEKEFTMPKPPNLLTCKTGMSHMSEPTIELERKLANVIENSRANAEIAQKLFDIETQILSCKTSQELLDQLLTSIKDKFNLTGICLLLAEPTPISYLLSGNMQSNWHQENSRNVALCNVSGTNRLE
jgi:uncharacterized protein YigA (DUF484 family)